MKKAKIEAILAEKEAELVTLSQRSVNAVQLYIYCIAVEQEYGKLPKALCINCFRTGTFIQESFKMEAYEEAKKWALGKIEEIGDDTDFDPNPNVFSCFWICGVSDNCEFDNSGWKRKG